MRWSVGLLLLLFLTGCIVDPDKAAKEQVDGVNLQYAKMASHLDELRFESYRDAIAMHEKVSPEEIGRTISKNNTYLDNADSFDFRENKIEIYYDCDSRLTCTQMEKIYESKIEDLIDLGNLRFWYYFERKDGEKILYIIEPDPLFNPLFESLNDTQGLRQLSYPRELESRFQSLSREILQKVPAMLSDVYSPEDTNENKSKKMQEFTAKSILEITRIGLELGDIKGASGSVIQDWEKIRKYDRDQVKKLLDLKKTTLNHMYGYYNENKILIPLNCPSGLCTQELNQSLTELKSRYIVSEDRIKDSIVMQEDDKSKLLRLNVIAKRLAYEISEIDRNDNPDYINDLAKKFNEESFCEVIRSSRDMQQKIDECMSYLES